MKQKVSHKKEKFIIFALSVFILVGGFVLVKDISKNDSRSSSFLSASSASCTAAGGTLKDSVSSWSGCGEGKTHFPAGDVGDQICCTSYAKLNGTCGETGEGAVCKKNSGLFGSCPDGWESSGYGGRDCASGLACCVREAASAATGSNLAATTSTDSSSTSVASPGGTCGESGENAICQKSQGLFGSCPDGWSFSGYGGTDCLSGYRCCVLDDLEAAIAGGNPPPGETDSSETASTSGNKKGVKVYKKRSECPDCTDYCLASPASGDQELILGLQAALGVAATGEWDDASETARQSYCDKKGSALESSELKDSESEKAESDISLSEKKAKSVAAELSNEGSQVEIDSENGVTITNEETGLQTVVPTHAGEVVGDVEATTAAKALQGNLLDTQKEVTSFTGSDAKAFVTTFKEKQTGLTTEQVTTVVGNGKVATTCKDGKKETITKTNLAAGLEQIVVVTPTSRGGSQVSKIEPPAVLEEDEEEDFDFGFSECKKGQRCSRKPVIYLYPPEPMDVRVEVDYDGEFTFVYPQFRDGGWDVRAQPDGSLVELATGRDFKYLFWEGVTTDPVEYDMSQSACVARDDVEDFLYHTLAEEMGLLPQEYNDFIVYWLPFMQKNQYSLIHFAEEEYTDIARLNITPTPDSVLRVFMTYTGVDECPTDLTTQSFEHFERDGFSVVEWGGTDLDDNPFD